MLKSKLEIYELQQKNYQKSQIWFEQTVSLSHNLLTCQP